jgi:NADH-quinone oxidoreductase subunit J
MELPLFVLLALGAIISGFLVITQRNPIHSAIALIFSLLSVAGLFALLTASFIAIIQVLIYAGAIMVLMLFVIMMLNLREEDLLQERKDLIWLLGIFLSVLVFYELVKTLPGTYSKSPDSTIVGFGSLTEIGKLLFAEYLLPFELISILLLIAVIGAVILSKRRLRPND